MMKKTVFLILILLSAGIVSAQSNCDGLPCGSIPWELPTYPELNSPTPMPTVAATATPTPVLTATPTPIPSTPTPNLGDVGAGAEDVSGLLTATAIPVEINGTPQTANFEDLADDSTMIVAYAKAITAADFGVITPMLQFVVFTMALTLVVKLIELSVPLASLAFGFLRKIAQTIMDFLPF